VDIIAAMDDSGSMLSQKMAHKYAMAVAVVWAMMESWQVNGCSFESYPALRRCPLYCLVI
jgi:hypothetical protein